MSAPKKMNEKERQISDALIEKLKQLMLKHDIKSDAECMRKIKEITRYDFNQPKFSNIKNGKAFPTMMELIAFSDFFNVSIDYLLGREQEFETFSVYEICENLARLFISDVEISFTDVFIDDYSYRALYFNTGYYIPYTSTPTEHARIIEDFIIKLEPVSKMAKNGTISKDTYSTIVSDLLKKCHTDSNSVDDDLPFFD